MADLSLTEKKNLRTKSPTADSGDVLGPVSNRSKYPAYRVVVYRLNYEALNPNKFSVAINGETRTFDDIFNIDPLSERYIDQVDWFAQDPENRIKQLLEEYYNAIAQKISDGLVSDGSVSHPVYKTNSDTSLIRATDITPLVTSVTTKINIDSPNGCTLQMINPTLATYNLPQLTKAYSFNQWLNYAKIVDPASSDAAGLVRLKSFKLKEYDLVRVFTYNGDIPLGKRMEQAVPGLGKVGYKITDQDLFILSNIMPVAFTGVVVSIRDQNSARQASGTTVECQGMMRILANTSTVVDQSLCNQIVMQHGFSGEDVSMVSKPVKIWSNFYSNKHAMDCFSTILDEYFKPETVVTKFDDGRDGNVVGGAPSLFRLLNSMYRPSSPGGKTPVVFSNVHDVKEAWPSAPTTAPTTAPVPAPVSALIYTPTSPDEEARSEYVTKSKIYAPSVATNYAGKHVKAFSFQPSFVQLLNLLLAYHVLKTRAGELIYYIDDSVDPYPEMDEKGLMVGDRSVNTLRPYMLMTKAGFQTYDAQYQSPYSVMETVRSSTYLEVFEDRMGTFHLRFPRYNCVLMDHELKFEDVTSVSINRGDSGNMNVVQAKWMVDLVGAMNPVPARVYVDPISVFKYGTRVTQNIENPNCISPTAAAEMAKFYRYFYLGMQSRSASIQCVGNPFICAGDMIAFKLGYAGNQNSGVSGATIKAGSPFTKQIGSNIAGGASTTYVGYVATVEDSISVDGVYTQNLATKFVRDAVVLDAKDGDIPIVRRKIVASARFNLGIPEAILNDSWGKTGQTTPGLDYYPAVTTFGSTDIKNFDTWCHLYARKSSRIGIFQRFYSVQDLAGVMAVDLAIREAEFDGSSDNGLISSVSFAGRIDDFIRMFNSAVQAWAENRAQLVALEIIYASVSKSAEFFASIAANTRYYAVTGAEPAFGSAPNIVTESPASRQNYQRMLDEISALEKDVAQKGAATLKTISGQVIIPLMGDPTATLEPYYVGGHLFETNECIGDVEQKEKPTFKSTLSTVDLNKFMSNIRATDKDVPSFYNGVGYEGMSLPDMVEIVKRGLEREAQAAKSPGEKAVAFNKSVLSYARVLNEIYTTVATGTKKLESAVRKQLQKKIANGVNLAKLANTICRMQQAVTQDEEAKKEQQRLDEQQRLREQQQGRKTSSPPIFTRLAIIQRESTL